MVSEDLKPLINTYRRDFHGPDFLLHLRQSRKIHKYVDCVQMFSGNFSYQVKAAERMSGPDAATNEFVDQWVNLPDQSIIYILEVADERNSQFAARLATDLQKLLDDTASQMDDNVRRDMTIRLYEYRSRKMVRAILGVPTTIHIKYGNIISYASALPPAEKYDFTDRLLGDLRDGLNVSNHRCHTELRNALMDLRDRETLRVLYESTAEGRDEPFRRHIEKQLARLIEDGTFSNPDKVWVRSLLQLDAPFTPVEQPIFSQGAIPTAPLRSNFGTPSVIGADSVASVLPGRAAADPQNADDLVGISLPSVSAASSNQQQPSASNQMPNNNVANVNDDGDTDSTISSVEMDDPQEAC